MPLGAARITLLAFSPSVVVEAEVIRAKVGVTALGNAQVDTAQSKFGGASAVFDGTGDSLQCYKQGGWNDIIDPSSAVSTIEFWVRFNSLATRQQITGYRDNVNTTNGFALEVRNDGKLYLYRSVFSTGYLGTTVLSTNTWYHIAIVIDGNLMKVYINGTLDITVNSSSFGTNPSDYYYVGWSGYTGLDPLNGIIDEFRISNTARYTAGFTPPTEPFVNDANTLLLLHMDGTDGSTLFEDDNGVRAKVGVTAAGNAQVDTAQSKFGGASALFDGSADYLYFQGNSWDLSGDFTIEAWVYQTSQTINQKLFDLRGITGSNPGADTSVALGDTLLIDVNPSGDFRCYVDGADRSSSGTGTISASTWTHIAVQRSSGTINAWVNGTRYVDYAGSDDYSSVFAVNQPIGAGGGQTGSLSSWDGNIDEVRISSTARYTNGASITVPTSAFTNDDNTLLLLHMDGTDASTDFIDDNGVRSKVGVSAVGNAQVDTAQSKFGGASALFDGTGDYLNTSLLVPQEDFTLECFFNGDNTAERFDLICTSGTGTQQGRTFLNTTTGNKLQFFIGDSVNGNALITGTTSITADNWHHAAVTRSGNDFKLFLDGNLEGSTTATSVVDAINPFQIGARESQLADVMRGHIDEVRISNTARYTAAFTPPTEPFGNDANTLLLLHMDGTDGSTTFIDDNS